MGITEIITSITAITAALTGGVGVLFLRERRRAEELKNEISIATEWQQMALHQREELREKDSKIDELYVEIGQWRAKDNDNTTRLAVLELQRCDVNGCRERRPPRGF